MFRLQGTIDGVHWFMVDKSFPRHLFIRVRPCDKEVILLFILLDYLGVKSAMRV